MRQGKDERAALLHLVCQEETDELAFEKLSVIFSLEGSVWNLNTTNEQGLSCLAIVFNTAAKKTNNWPPKPHTYFQNRNDVRRNR